MIYIIKERALKILDLNAEINDTDKGLSHLMQFYACTFMQHMKDFMMNKFHRIPVEKLVLWKNKR